MQKFIIGMLVSNQFGVLTRVSGMFARRGFNIDSLTVGVTEDSNWSRMTVTMTGDEYARDQMIKQLRKLHDVRQIKEMDTSRSVLRELILMKVRSTPETRQEILDAVNVFRNKIVDYSSECLCLEMTGEPGKLEAFIELMRPYGIIEMCRTGLISVDRSLVTLRESGN